MKERKEKTEYLSIIIRELSKSGFASKESLMEACELKERQLKSYVSILEDNTNPYGVLVKYNRSKDKYEISRQVNLVNITLNPNEIAALKSATKTLNQFAQLPIFQDLQGLFEKLNQAVYFRTKTEAQETIEFESVPYVEGVKFLKDCWEAIHEKKTIEIAYQKFDSLTVETRTLHPYLIKEHRNRWYVIGLEHSKQALRMFGLDRIKAIHPTIGIRYEPNQKDLKKLFNRSFGLYFNYSQSPERIILLFTGKRIEYIQTQPFHSQQLESSRLKMTPQGLQLELDLILNEELVMELARLGKDVKVIAPESLKKSVKDYLINALEQYQSNQ
ncbi:MAG: WYL domain-containing protein [Chitinophagales bacterium]|jgi:predicted DNA-binding transcriptional regulator YafY|nr:WYL domain-containing protein [Chitinophagales bacterium]